MTAFALGAGAVAVWRLAHRLPLEEARQFITAPVVVGDEPPPPPAGVVDAKVIEGRFETARTAFRAGSYADAARDFSWVVTQDPRGPHAGAAQWNLTRSRLRNGEGNAAFAALQDLFAHYAGYLGEQAPELRHGVELMAKGDLPGAQTAFEHMVRDQPDSEFVPMAHLLIGRVHWSQNQPMEAVRSFARMFSSVKDPVPGYVTLSRQLERYAEGDKEVAQSFSRLARDGQENFRDIYQYLAARSLLEQDHFQAAHDALEELRQKYPQGDFSHLVDLEHAWNLLRNGQAAESLTIFQQLEQRPTPSDALGFDEFFDIRAELPMGIARCQLALGNYAEAVTAFERALQNKPGIYGLQDEVGLSLAHEQLGHLEQAAAVLRRAIDAHPSDPQLPALRQQLTRVEGRLAAAR